MTSTNTGGGRTKSDHLVLRTDDALLRELESPEWGRPVALGAVFVRFIPHLICSIILCMPHTRLSCLRDMGADDILKITIYRTKRSRSAPWSRCRCTGAAVRV